MSETSVYAHVYMHVVITCTYTATAGASIIRSTMLVELLQLVVVQDNPALELSDGR